MHPLGVLGAYNSGPVPVPWEREESAGRVLQSAFSLLVGHLLNPSTSIISLISLNTP